MANLVFDFLHHYVTGERRASDPADAYQYDEGHVMEAVVPVAVTSCEIHYWVRGQEESEAYVPESMTQNEDGSYSIIGHIPNTYFETYGELRVYIVVTDGTASITTYEGRIHICERSKPDDYVDDDPENEATRVLNEAREAAATATAAAETCEEVRDSIPADYSQLSDDVDDLKDGLTAVESDVTDLKEDLSDMDDRVTALEEGGSGSGLTDDIKQALLQIAEKVAYVDDDGQDYYGALEDALYPPADLVSISCVYTQSGTVYDTDSLDSLKSDLVVTALYDDQSTATVTAYTLSGTLETGTSTITVAYGGKTTTFNVTVSSAPPTPIYNWDLKTGLTDSVHSEVATKSISVTLTEGIGAAFTAGNCYIDYGAVYGRNRTYEVDVAVFGTPGASNQHRRLLAFGTSTNTSTGAAALLYRANTGWRFYSGSSWDSTALTDTDGQYIFDGKTVKLYLDADGYAEVSYKTIGADDSTYILLGKSTETLNDITNGHVYNGGSNADSLKSITISGLRIYEGEK